jgi:hypothetical protein
MVDQAARHWLIGKSMDGIDVKELDRWIDKALAKAARDGIEA